MTLDILIADHDAELANLYCRFLADHGFSAHRVESGLECLTRVNRRVPDVLVLDRGLARGDATGVLACLREDDVSLPVILATWSASPEIARKLVIPPVVHCLHKFFPLAALLDGIDIAVKSIGTSRHAFNYEVK